MNKRKLEDVEFTNQEDLVATKNGKFIEDGEKYDPYAMSKSHKFPVWLKACFTKWWVAGMVFYFIYFGVSYGAGLKDRLFAIVLGIAWGAVTDVFVNHAFRGFNTPSTDYKKYIFFGKERAFVTLPVNIIYGAFISLIAAFEIMHTVFGLIAGSNEELYYNLMLYLAPFFYAFLMLALDMAFIAIRNAIEKAIIKRRNKNTN